MKHFLIYRQDGFTVKIMEFDKHKDAVYQMIMDEEDYIPGEIVLGTAESLETFLSVYPEYKPS